MRRLTGALTAVVITAAAPAWAAPAPATGPPAWASAATASIHPGVQITYPGAQCTANFVFHQPARGRDGLQRVYLGTAAHCFPRVLADGASSLGCTAPVLPLGSRVSVQGASRPARLVYSSYLAMQGRRELNDNACRGNDFALVELDRADWRKVNPSVPFWGGPTGLDRDGVTTGDRVFAYGASIYRRGVEQLHPSPGRAVGSASGGWSHTAYMANPGIFGDSGGLAMSGDGTALGVYSTINQIPPGSNTFADLAKALAYLDKHGTFDVVLARGTEPFRSLPTPGGLASDE